MALKYKYVIGFLLIFGISTAQNRQLDFEKRGFSDFSIGVSPTSWFFNTLKLDGGFTSHNKFHLLETSLEYQFLTPNSILASTAYNSHAVGGELKYKIFVPGVHVKRSNAYFMAGIRTRYLTTHDDGQVYSTFIEDDVPLYRVTEEKSQVSAQSLSAGPGFGVRINQASGLYLDFSIKYYFRMGELNTDILSFEPEGMIQNYIDEPIHMHLNFSLGYTFNRKSKTEGKTL